MPGALASLAFWFSWSVIKQKKNWANIHPVKPQICADGVCMRANILNTDQRMKKKNQRQQKGNAIKKQHKVSEKKCTHSQERKAQTNKKSEWIVDCNRKLTVESLKASHEKKTNHKPVKMAFNRIFDTMRLYFPFGHSLTSCHFHHFHHFRCVLNAKHELFTMARFVFCSFNFSLFTLLRSHAIFGLFSNNIQTTFTKEKQQKNTSTNIHKNMAEIH